MHTKQSFIEITFTAYKTFIEEVNNHIFFREIKNIL